MNYKKISIIFSVLLPWLALHGLQEENLGVCVVPVADLIGSPIRELGHLDATVNSYRSFPHSILKTDNSCPRLHQLLFNEIVEIKKVTRKEILISVPNYFYESSDKRPSSLFWTLRSNIMSLKDLKDLGVETHKIPTPLMLHTSNLWLPLHNTITLSKPFTDPRTQTTYSAGTRFMLASHNIGNSFGAYAFNPKHKTMVVIFIPKNICITYDNNKTKHDYRIEFVQLLKSWAHLDKGFIPYVLGGSSYYEPCVSERYQEEKTSCNCLYRRTQTIYPCSGLDCSGLIARAAQMVGIPFFPKNSIAIEDSLLPLKKGERLAEGDIIWIPGHVMVVSDLKNNQLIEARSYSHGYGKVHEIPVHEEFKDMITYDDLLHSYFEHKALRRLDKNGVQVQTIPEFKILRLTSAWVKNSPSKQNYQ